MANVEMVEAMTTMGEYGMREEISPEETIFYYEWY